jgi:hypothetical protein
MHLSLRLLRVYSVPSEARRHLWVTIIPIWTYGLELWGCASKSNTVDSRLFAAMVGRIGADNQNQRINRSTHTQARYTGIKLTGA